MPAAFFRSAAVRFAGRYAVGTELARTRARALALTVLAAGPIAAALALPNAPDRWQVEGIADLDIPWVPEGVEAKVIDPLIAAYAPDLLRHFTKLALPSLIDLVISASRGELKVNQPPLKSNLPE